MPELTAKQVEVIRRLSLGADLVANRAKHRGESALNAPLRLSGGGGNVERPSRRSINELAAWGYLERFVDPSDDSIQTFTLAARLPANTPQSALAGREWCDPCQAWHRRTVNESDRVAIGCVDAAFAPKAGGDVLILSAIMRAEDVTVASPDSGPDIKCRAITCEYQRPDGSMVEKTFKSVGDPYIPKRMRESEIDALADQWRSGK